MSTTFTSPVGMYDEFDMSNATTVNYKSGSIDGADISSTAAIARTKLAKETINMHLPWENWRVWNAYSTLLPATSASDDLGLYAGAFGTNTPSIQTFDIKTLTTNLYARQTWVIPPEYSAGQPLTLRINAGMVTTVADTSCTIDAAVYKSDGAASLGADICATAATSINSLTAANKDFTITPTGLAAGDVLDLRLDVSVVDGATGTAVYAYIYAVKMIPTLQG